MKSFKVILCNEQTDFSLEFYMTFLPRPGEFINVTEASLVGETDIVKIKFPVGRYEVQSVDHEVAFYVGYNNTPVITVFKRQELDGHAAKLYKINSEYPVTYYIQQHPGHRVFHWPHNYRPATGCIVYLPGHTETYQVVCTEQINFEIRLHLKIVKDVQR